jgi:hypothetical protein
LRTQTEEVFRSAIPELGPKIVIEDRDPRLDLERRS